MDEYEKLVHLSVGQQGVHTLQEARVQHVGLVHDEGDLLVLAAGTTQNRTQVLVKVLTCVLPVNLWGGDVLVKLHLSRTALWASFAHLKHFTSTTIPFYCAHEIQYIHSMERKKKRQKQVLGCQEVTSYLCSVQTLI